MLNNTADDKGIIAKDAKPKEIKDNPPTGLMLTVEDFGMVEPGHVPSKYMIRMIADGINYLSTDIEVPLLPTISSVKQSHDRVISELTKFNEKNILPLFDERYQLLVSHMIPMIIRDLTTKNEYITKVTTYCFKLTNSDAAIQYIMKEKSGYIIYFYISPIM